MLGGEVPNIEPLKGISRKVELKERTYYDMIR